jgi:hypothetical protein
MVFVNARMEDCDEQTLQVHMAARHTVLVAVEWKIACLAALATKATIVLNIPQRTFLTTFG